MAVGQTAQKKPDPCSFVIFGVTGDLAHRLVVPALYNLAASDLLPDKFCLVGVARKGVTSDKLRDSLMKGLRQFATRPVDDAIAQRAAEVRGLMPVIRAGQRAKLQARLADLAPGDLNRVFYTTSGSEAVESAWKLAKQYFKLTGEPGRYKVLSREIAYHGTSMGALAITGRIDLVHCKDSKDPVGSGRDRHEHLPGVPPVRRWHPAWSVAAVTFVAILELVLISAEEANVFVVNVYVDETV